MNRSASFLLRGVLGMLSVFANCGARREFSQAALGQRARVSYKFIGEIERGITCPNLVFDIASALNCHVTTLFGTL